MFSSIPALLDELLIGGNVARRARLASRIPASIVPAIRRDKFRRLLRYVNEKSPFYRRRFKEAGIDVRRVRTPEDLGGFFTTAQDLRENPVEDFLCGRPELGFETTGTTSTTSKRVYFSRREAADMGRDGALGLYNLGLRPEDRVVDAFDYSFWNAPFTLRASLDRLGSFHVTAAKMPPAEFYDRVKPYGFNVMFVEPSWLVVLTEIARVRGTWPVKFFYVGGENMSEDTRHYIERSWNTKVYIGYGQTESFGQVGTECPAQRGYHVDDFNLYCEIVDKGEDGHGFSGRAVHMYSEGRAPHRENPRAFRRDGQLRHGQPQPLVLRAAARRPSRHYARLAGGGTAKRESRYDRVPRGVARRRHARRGQRRDQAAREGAHTRLVAELRTEALRV
jgi:hypothetical protein